MHKKCFLGRAYKTKNTLLQNDIHCYISFPHWPSYRSLMDHEGIEGDSKKPIRSVNPTNNDIYTLGCRKNVQVTIICIRYDCTPAHFESSIDMLKQGNKMNRSFEQSTIRLKLIENGNDLVVCHIFGQLQLPESKQQVIWLRASIGLATNVISFTNQLPYRFLHNITDGWRSVNRFTS